MREQSSASKRTVILWALVAINAVLLVVVLNRYLRPNTAMAQAPAPGDYMVSPGVLSGQSDGVMFVLDTRNGLLNIIGYNSVTGQLGASTPIDVARVMQGGTAPGRH